MVVCTRVVRLDMKKLSAPRRISPFIISDLWVSTLLLSPSCNSADSGDFISKSANAAAKSRWLSVILWKCCIICFASLRSSVYLIWVSFNINICSWRSVSTVFVPVPNRSEKYCTYLYAAEILHSFRSNFWALLTWSTVGAATDDDEAMGVSSNASVAAGESLSSAEWPLSCKSVATISIWSQLMLEKWLSSSKSILLVGALVPTATDSNWLSLSLSDVLSIVPSCTPQCWS